MSNMRSSTRLSSHGLTNGGVGEEATDDNSFQFFAEKAFQVSNVIIFLLY